MADVKLRSIIEIFGLIGTVIVAWLFLSTQFVKAQDYYEDNLMVQLSFVEITIHILEDRIERANKAGDANKATRLYRRLMLLEKKQVIIEGKQLNGRNNQ